MPNDETNVPAPRPPQERRISQRRKADRRTNLSDYHRASCGKTGCDDWSNGRDCCRDRQGWNSERRKAERRNESLPSRLSAREFAKRVWAPNKKKEDWTSAHGWGETWKFAEAYHLAQSAGLRRELADAHRIIHELTHEYEKLERESEAELQKVRRELAEAHAMQDGLSGAVDEYTERAEAAELRLQQLVRALVSQDHCKVCRADRFPHLGDKVLIHRADCAIKEVALPPAPEKSK